MRVGVAYVGVQGDIAAGIWAAIYSFQDHLDGGGGGDGDALVSAGGGAWAFGRGRGSSVLLASIPLMALVALFLGLLTFLDLRLLVCVLLLFVLPPVSLGREYFWASLAVALES